MRTGRFYLRLRPLRLDVSAGICNEAPEVATISVLYSVSLVLLLTAIGVVLFRESAYNSSRYGIVLAVASLVLLCGSPSEPRQCLRKDLTSR